MVADERKDPREPLSRLTAVALFPFPLNTANPKAGPSADLRIGWRFGAARFAEHIDFFFHLDGRGPADLQRVKLPEPLAHQSRQRQNELWKTTCLELFLGPASQSSYLEVNLSPSGHWNVYAFDGYRHGMREAEGVAVHLQEVRDVGRGQKSWHARLLGGDVRRALNSGGLVLSASAVVEYETGDREYWSVAHTGDRPDFHRREGFRLTL